MTCEQLRRLDTPAKVKTAIKELREELKSNSASVPSSNDDLFLDDEVNADIQGEIMLLENMLSRMVAK